MKIDDKTKQLIENRPVALTTVMEDGKTNAVVVADLKVVSANQIVITDNFMKQTIEDISHNPNVVILVWESDMSYGVKFVGTAEYFTEGEWLDFVKAMPANEGLAAKGALLVTVDKYFQSA